MENGLNPPFTIFVVRGEASEAQVPGLEMIGLWNDGGGHSTTRPSAVEQKQVRDALEGMREMFPPAVPGTLTDETFRVWCQLRLEALRTKIDDALRELPRGDIHTAWATARSLTRLAAEYTDILDAFHVCEDVPGSPASAAE
jgi:hypothetical protein